ncbi:type IV toxin-antitoxin system AbiEi family antitoxin [Agromyces sp. ZXT2-6]|uniref:type IV toxin-antitoxin system AbiEi family antitoxin n=1 Tax=Agromyces sp. ZXT2-6 TaxID=3461153 RepID=UPI004054B4AC
MARLPTVLGTRDLPLPELCAARLDGELVTVGDGWCPVDEPDLPSLRAAAVAPHRHGPLIVERRTAAWVHGAVPAPPVVSEYCIRYADRSTARIDPGCVVREVVIDDADVAVVGGIRCTTPLRTAFDLLRDASAGDDETVAIVGALLEGEPGLESRLRDRIGSAHRLPHKSRALARLDAATRQPSLTR